MYRKTRRHKLFNFFLAEFDFSPPQLQPTSLQARGGNKIALHQCKANGVVKCTLAQLKVVHKLKCGCYKQQK